MALTIWIIIVIFLYACILTTASYLGDFKVFLLTNIAIVTGYIDGMVRIYLSK